MELPAIDSAFQWRWTSQGSLPGHGSLPALFSTVESGQSARCRTSPCMPGKVGAPPWIPLWRLNFLIPCKKENHGAKRQAFKIIINVGLVADMKSASQRMFHCKSHSVCHYFCNSKQHTPLICPSLPKEFLHWCLTHSKSW